MKKLKLGIIGTGRIAKRFIKDAVQNKNIEVQSVFSRNILNVKAFCNENSIPCGFTGFNDFLNSNIDIVYIASPHETHYSYSKECLLKEKHVLCEKPLTLNNDELKELIAIAKEKDIVFLEAIKTAFMPNFLKVLEQVNSGIIGDILEVRATFTKLTTDKRLREYDQQFGGATNELGTYPLLLAVKILGEIDIASFYPIIDNHIDVANRMITTHQNNKIAISTVGIGMKQEGCAVISGTKGYIYIPAPWWLSNEFYIRFEDVNKEIKHTVEHTGNGFSYEIDEFIHLIQQGKKESDLLSHKEISEINRIISIYNLQKQNRTQE